MKWFFFGICGVVLVLVIVVFAVRRFFEKNVRDKGGMVNPEYQKAIDSSAEESNPDKPSDK